MERPRGKLVSFLLLAFVVSSARATGLIQALQNAGASQFAAQIQANPDALAIYSSNRVQTVFAPIDGPTNSTLQRRQSNPNALQELLYHSTANTNTLGSMSSGSGMAIKSNDISPQLGGKSQVFVSTPLSKSSSNTCGGQAVQEQVVESDNWHWHWPWVYITVTVSVYVPVTVFVTIDDIHLSTVHDTDFITIQTTEVTTVQKTDFITEVTTVPTTVEETDFITKVTTVPTTVEETDFITKVTTVPTTVEETFSTTDFITVPTTKVTTFVTTALITSEETKFVTVPTTIATTKFSTVSETVSVTRVTTVSTAVPTTVLATISTEVLSIIRSTVVDTVHDTKLVTVPTIIPTTVLDTLTTKVPTKVPITVSTVVTTRLLPTCTPSLVKLSSGLGNAVNIIRGDIPYDGGIIQIIDGHLTLPESLTDTANANGQTAFTGLASSYNLTNTLDNSPDITYFIPSNSAFAIEGATNSYPSIESLLLGHLIPNFAGYLPSLTDGSTYKSQGGSEFTVTVKGTDYYINNAKIILANVIVENGVAHVLDQVIQPSSTPTQTPLPNAGSSSRGGYPLLIVISWTCVLFLVGAFCV